MMGLWSWASSQEITKQRPHLSLFKAATVLWKVVTANDFQKPQISSSQRYIASKIYTDPPFIISLY